MIFYEENAKSVLDKGTLKVGAIVYASNLFTELKALVKEDNKDNRAEALLSKDTDNIRVKNLKDGQEHEVLFVYLIPEKKRLMTKEEFEAEWKRRKCCALIMKVNGTVTYKYIDHFMDVENRVMFTDGSIKLIETMLKTMYFADNGDDFYIKED